MTGAPREGRAGPAVAFADVANILKKKKVTMDPVVKVKKRTKKK
jgi:hypothetical protein